MQINALRYIEVFKLAQLSKNPEIFFKNPDWVSQIRIFILKLKMGLASILALSWSLQSYLEIQSKLNAGKNLFSKEKSQEDMVKPNQAMDQMFKCTKLRHSMISKEVLSLSTLPKTQLPNFGLDASEYFRHIASFKLELLSKEKISVYRHLFSQ